MGKLEGRDPPRLVADPHALSGVRRHLVAVNAAADAPFDFDKALARLRGALTSLPSAPSAPSDPSADTLASANALQESSAGRTPNPPSGFRAFCNESTRIARSSPILVAVLVMGVAVLVPFGLAMWRGGPSPETRSAGTVVAAETARQGKPSHSSAPAYEAADTSAPSVAVNSLPEASPSPSRSPSTFTPGHVGSVDRGDHASLLRQEVEHLDRLRQAESNDPRTAVQMADEGHRRFQESVLYQEREAIAIRALVKSGNVDLARDRAKRFLASFPSSRLAQSVQIDEAH